MAPASLKATGAFNDGITKVLAGYAAALAQNTEAGREAAADMLVQAHKNSIRDFVTRDLGGSINEFRTLLTPDAFNTLLEHKKLMNVDFQGGNGGNDFAQRRVAYLNGLPVIETPRFPLSAISDHHLGPQFNVTATEALSEMVIFHPRKTLVTVEAQGMTARVWDDEKEFTNVMDSYCMYTVGIKRGDCVSVVRRDA